MAIELVLKHIGKLPALDFSLQTKWGNKSDGSFSDFNDNSDFGVTFKQQYDLKRDDNFPLQELFNSVDAELEAGRYVIVSIKNPIGFHMYVIYEKDTSTGEFHAVSKDIQDNNLCLFDVKKRITQMQGTDILTYS